MTTAQPYSTATARDLDAYFAQVTANYADLANPFAYYRWLVDQLAALPDVEFAPLSLATNGPSPGRRRIVLRHDIDADPVAALRAARYLARLGIAGSFYLLHTAPYYGDFIDGVFVRHPALVDWIHGFIVAGCEIGLHNDVFGAVAAHGIDGADCLRTELQWLREQGANVQGTVAHNSAPVHGAENYEIFAGHVLWEREVTTADGRSLPLGVLDPIDAGLGYEGTWAMPKDATRLDEAAAAAFVADRAAADVRNEAWMRTYLTANPICDWLVDVQLWLIGRDRWVVSGRGDRDPLFEFGIDGVRAVQIVRELPIGTRAVVVIHPEYVRG